MKRTYRFATILGTVQCQVSADQWIELPVFAGILKHPTVEELPRLLREPNVARKYTRLALGKAAWQILRCFPREWLRENLADAQLRPSRYRAIDYLLS